MPKITIFTPTYNRGLLLTRLYNSLVNQTYKNFEWVIVDDGSTDDTRIVVEKFIKEDKIKIRYVYKENGGKHRAINKGIDLAAGEYFFIVDSDDFLPIDSLKIYNKYLFKVKDSKYAGLAGLKAYNSNEIIGNTFNGNEIDIYNYERKKYGITGDKAEFYKTKILKKFKFPEFDNEKFLNESIVWNEIALNGYKLKFFNEITYYCEYLDSGLTSNINEHLKNSPEGLKMYINQLLNINKFNFIERIKLISFYYELVSDKYSIKEIAENLNVKIFSVKICYLIRRIFKKIKK